MFKRTGGILALVILGALSLSLMNCGSSSSRPSGLLYVLSQEQSNVSSFALDLSSGNLSLINSNAVTCPPSTTCGSPLQISLDPQGKTAFVLDQGFVSAYTVNSDGSLSVPVSGGPAYTGGETALAMTRDAAGAFLFVITDAPAIHSYTTSPGSTTITPAPTSPFPLTRVPTSLSAITYTPQGSSTAQTLLFMTSNQDLTASHNDNELSVYSVDSSGNLTEQPNSPYTTPGQVDPTVVQAVNTSPAGAPTAGAIFVYVGNSGSSAGAVGVFELCTAPGEFGVCTQQDVTDNLLFPAGTPSNVGQNPVAMLVDPTNSFLYIACNGTNQVYGFSMGTTSGKLSALSPASVPTGAQPVALAMHGGLNSSSEFLYSSNNGSSTITGWPVEATTGTLGSAFTTLFTPGAPSGMAGR